MTSNLKVSIITASYNSSNTILDTIRSLEMQTYHNIEYIIVDGASSDNTLEVISNHCTRVSKVISESDNGIYDALNKGINAATGDIVGFLHSDDLFAYRDAIKDIVSTIKSQGTDAVHADLEYVEKDDINKRIRLWKSSTYFTKKLKRGWMPAHPTFYMKREKYMLYGAFDLSYKIAADYDSLLRYFGAHGITSAYLPQVLIKMRVGGASNSSLKNLIQKTKEDIRALKSNGLSWPYAIFIKNISKIPQFFGK